MSINTADVVLSSREDANAVLDAMKQLLEAYEMVTVADFLELAGLSSTYSDSKVGWVNLINIQIQPVDGGFILALPPAKDV